MQFSYQWLRQWVELDLSPEALAERMTDAGLEVDSVTPAAADFEGVFVAEITRCEPHPDADRLRVCQVAYGDESEVQIVCGAPNAEVGLKAPLAVHGARLPGDFKIRKTRLRGVASHGMLCSAKELGLSEDASGLMALPADAPVGDKLRDYLRLDDAVIEVELTPNRADCLSIAGLAREIGAILDGRVNPVDSAAVPAQIDDELEIELAAPADCPRYAGRIIRGIDPTATTPLWMRERLRRAGIRSISPVVDVTNYVLMERGQPMHGFDLDRVDRKILVRRAEAGEKLVLLDDREVTLDEEFLVIADASGAVALGGIMGGASTAVADSTRNILLESAYFNPATIMGRARRLGLHTDASHRFERGVDPSGQVAAIERATELLLDICGGRPGPVVVAESPSDIPARPAVGLRHRRLTRVLGTEVPAQQVTDILNRLGMSVEPTDEGWQATPPPSRFDIAIEEDLIEEVARIYGYNALPTTPPAGEVRVSDTSEHEISLSRVRGRMTALGYSEAISYSFVDRGLLQRLGVEEGAFALANPLAADMDVMRTALFPGLLTALRGNLNRQLARVRLFETGKVFQAYGAALNEYERLAAVACGTARPEQWDLPARPLDYYDIKGDLEQLLALRGAQTLAFEPSDAGWLHPGQAARIVLDGEVVGWIGAFHPAALARLDIERAVYGFELSLPALRRRQLPVAGEISRFPSIRRDLAVVLPASVSYAELAEVVREAAGEWLRDLLLFDVYQGEHVEKGHKSIAMGLILQDVSSTLKDQQVEAVQEDVLTAVKQRFNARLRG